MPSTLTRKDVITHTQCLNCDHYRDLRGDYSKHTWFMQLSKADDLQHKTGCAVPLGYCGLEYDNRYVHTDDYRVDGSRAACCVGPGPFCLLNDDC